MPSRLPAVLAVVVGLLALTVPAAGASTGPGAAKAKPGAPGSLTGYGFDACAAPPQAVMDAWWEQSPYSAVGIYIGGSNRLCKDQTELTAGWVRHPAAHRLATCCRSRSGRRRAARATPTGCRPTSPPPSSRGAPRRRRPSRPPAGSASGRGARSTTTSRTTTWRRTTAVARRSVFLSGWTDALHAPTTTRASTPTSPPPSPRSTYADRADPTVLHDARRHLVRLGQRQRPTPSPTSGCSDRRVGRPRPGPPVPPSTCRRPTAATPSTIDANWLDVGEGSVGSPGRGRCARASTSTCGGTRRCCPGSRGPAVAAAQCLLRKLRAAEGHSPAAATTSRPSAAVKKAQRKLDQKQTGKITRRTWVALLARGRSPCSRSAPPVTRCAGCSAR